MNENPARKRRRTTSSERKFLVPLLNGRRVRRSSDPLPGTAYVTTSEYIALKEEPASNSQLEQAAKAPPRRGKRKGDNTDAVSSIPTKPTSQPTEQAPRRRRKIRAATSLTPSTLNTQATKPIPHPLKDQYEPIKTFTDEFSEQIARQFIQDLIPESLLASLSEEQLRCQKQELSANLADSIHSQLYWALNRAWLDARSNRSSR